MEWPKIDTDNIPFYSHDLSRTLPKDPKESKQHIPSELSTTDKVIKEVHDEYWAEHPQLPKTEVREIRDLRSEEFEKLFLAKERSLLINRNKYPFVLLPQRYQDETPDTPDIPES